MAYTTYDTVPSTPSLNNDSRAYRILAMALIFLCRFKLRKLLIASDEALRSADEAGNEISKEVDDKFREAICLLSDLEKDFPDKDRDKSRSALMILHALKADLHSKSMGNQWLKPELTRVVEFHLLTSLQDPHPVVVELLLSNTLSLQEILWNFSRFKDEKKRLTLRDNPHFYAELPMALDAYGNRTDSVKIDPTDDFRHANKLYVLTDRREPVHIVTNRDTQFFSNFWCVKNSIVFKDICGRLRGGSIVKASLKGTNCGFCKRLPVSTVPRASRDHRGLPPIITHWNPSMIGECLISCHPMHSSVDFGLCVCAERAAPDSVLLAPLPPTSEQPGYSVAYRTHIHMLDSDSLLQIFNCYRLEDKDNWYLRLTWRNLIHVCQRWRYLVSDSWSLLDIHLLLTNNSPSIHTLSHLPPIHVAIDYSDGTRAITREDEDNILLGLQQHGHVHRVVLHAPASTLCTWLEPMNKRFPKLRDLSLLSTTTEEMTRSLDLVLPETLQAPDLRYLSLHGIGLPKKLSLLSSTAALSTLSLAHIGNSCYFSPGHLVTQLQGLPHVEELSIDFAIPIPLPSSEGDLLPSPIPPVTLPSLRRLTFRGVGVYLDNLVAQINTPLLERLSLTLFFELAYTLVNLAEFIHRTEGFGCLVAQVTFTKDGPFIDAEQRDIRKLSLHVNCEPLDWQIDSATQLCGALGEVLSGIEELTLDLNSYGMPRLKNILVDHTVHGLHAVDLDGSTTSMPDLETPSDSSVSDSKSLCSLESLDVDEMPVSEITLDDILWHELLLPFIGVKKLRISSSLTVELALALDSVAEELVLILLPELQELHVQPNGDRERNALAAFVETRESIGRAVRLFNSLLDTPMLHIQPTPPSPTSSESNINIRRWVSMANNSPPINPTDMSELVSEEILDYGRHSAPDAGYSDSLSAVHNDKEAPPKKE